MKLSVAYFEKALTSCFLPIEYAGSGVYNGLPPIHPNHKNNPSLPVSLGENEKRVGLI
jgi:hypothetical protein